jgi:TRAP-type C4-dicarboxylate transport system permease small subunit
MPLLDYMNNISISPDGVLRFKLSELSLSQRQSVFATLMFTVASFCCVYGALLYFLQGILRSVEKGSPFVKENASRLSIIGYILLGGSVIVGLAYSATANAMVEALKITGISVNFHLNSTMFASGLLLLILAGVFHYGSYLQDEYDATL